MWRGASHRVLSAHWLPSVVRSSSGQSVTVRVECLFVLHDGTPSRHWIWLTGRHCWTVCHARLCYQEDWRYLCQMHTCTLLVNFCCIIGPTGSIMNKLTYLLILDFFRFRGIWGNWAVYIWDFCSLGVAVGSWRWYYILDFSSLKASGEIEHYSTCWISPVEGQRGKVEHGTTSTKLTISVPHFWHACVHWILNFLAVENNQAKHFKDTFHL